MNKATQFIIGIVILGLGILALIALITTKPKAKKKKMVNLGVAVDITSVQRNTSRITIRARGTVKPSREVLLGTQVGGKVVKISPELQPGGSFEAGDIILRVDPSDYRIAVEQSFAQVDSAQALLSVEKSRQTIAKREWEMFGGKGNKELALRAPQMRSATTRLKSARSGLKKARLSVERTLLRAPFKGMIQMRNVDLGQNVGPGAGLIRYVGTQTYWVQISIPVERLSWISIPNVNAETGSKVKIYQRIGKDTIEKQGQVLRLLSDVDPAGHMARVLIEVKDPLGNESPLIKKEGGKPLPLLLGSYVEVEIEGPEADDVFELERGSLRSGNTVYIMTPTNTLEKRKVEILWRRENRVLVSSGIQTGDRIVISPLASAVEGMKLRLPNESRPTSKGKSVNQQVEAPVKATKIIEPAPEKSAL